MSITPSQDKSLKLIFAEIARTHHFCKEEETRLGTLCQQGDRDARIRLWKGNLRFAITTAKKFQHENLAFADLLQEAMVGLWIATEKFDPKAGVKFLTYAEWWMRQRLSRYSAKYHSQIKIPESQLAAFRKVAKLASKYDNEEISIPLEALQEEANLTKKQAEVQPFSVTSLSTQVNEDSTIEEFLESEEKMEENILATDNTAYLHKLLNLLPDKDRNILTDLYGLNGNQLSHVEVSKKYNMSGAQLKKYVSKLLIKLRNAWDIV